MATEKIKNVRVERGLKNLSSVTDATTDIYKIQPILARETKKGDVFNIGLKQINICDALGVPSFVNVRSFNTFFYVPYAKVWQAFESTVGNTSINLGSNRKFNNVPTINKYVIWSILFYNGWYDYVDGTSQAYDFRFHLESYDGLTEKYFYVRLTGKGRRFWAILQGLGYRFNMFFHCKAESDGQYRLYDSHALQVSALPLMAYSKIYFENYCPSKYADKYNIAISQIYNLSTAFYVSNNYYSFISYDDDSNCYVSSTDLPSYGFFNNLANLLLDVFYGDDYFTSSPVESMVNPDGLNTDETIFDITKPNSDGTTLVNSDNNNDYTPVHSGIQYTGTPPVGVPTTAPQNVTDYIHNMLHMLTKNIQLKALAGSKLAQRIYALYGIKSQTYNMQAVTLGQDVSDIDVKAITSLGDTRPIGGAELGQKGGQMNNYSEGKIHCEHQEFGIIICVNAIIPTYFYGQGMHREMMHVKPDDFYNDRFALAGYQNIGRFELFADDYLGYYKKLGSEIDTSFGKTSSYAEYALRKDCIMGDFALLSRTAGLDAYHFNRYLVDQYQDMLDGVDVASLGMLPQNNEDFLKVVQGRSGSMPTSKKVNHQFDRLFVDVDSEDDHIVQYTEFSISAIRDGRNINDFTIGEEDGKEIELAGFGKVLYN